ncbi:MAG: extracellular solute-binding protein, partial [Butyrivibrio sp.]|nr:extracellular solute-binding protein [Butyrivibrio sp.]
MNKKVLATFFATVLATTTLVGCGGSSATTTPSAGGSGADATAQANSSAGKQTDGKNLPTLTTEPLEITLWDIATEDPAKTTQEGAVQRFMKDYPNIKVNQVHQQNDNYKQQLVVAMSSGQAPDIYVHWGG